MSSIKNPDPLFHVRLATKQNNEVYKLTFDSLRDLNSFNKVVGQIIDTETFKGKKTKNNNLTIDLPRGTFKAIVHYLNNNSLQLSEEFFAKHAKETPLSPTSLSNTWNIEVNNYTMLETMIHQLSKAGLYFPGFGIISDGRQSVETMRKEVITEFFDVKTKNQEATEPYVIRLTSAAHRKLSTPVIPLNTVQTTGENKLAATPSSKVVSA